MELQAVTTSAPPLVDVALAAHAAGLCVVPTRQDGSKRPDGPWQQYQQARPSEAELRTWFANGRTGIGLICGAVSHNLEMLELDHGGSVLWRAFLARAAELGLDAVVERVVTGYVERTPGGGLHLLYRCTEPIDGNTKLAREVDAETGELRVLFETRGEGGFVVVAPSSGSVHPSGRPWELAGGGFDTIAVLTPTERAQLLDLARSFDRMPAEAPSTEGAKPEHLQLPTPAASWMDATVEAFCRATTWAEILVPRGWVEMRPAGGVGYWCRPGKNPRDGHSATTNANGTDRFILWSTSVQIPGVEVATGGPHQPSYDRFGVWAGYVHGGDRLEAAKAARQAGHGPPWSEHENLDLYEMTGIERPSSNGNGVPVQAGSSTCNEAWEAPLALEGPPLPSFPTASLPDWMAEHCEVVAERLQVPVDLCGQLALGALATISMGRVKVAVRPSWVEHVNLYLTTVMPSGSGKSPADRAIVGPVRALEAKLLALHAVVRREAEVRLAVAERKARKALEAASKDGSLTEAILAEQEAANLEVPPTPRLLAGDATPEVLAVLLDAHAGRIAVVSTEAELYDLVLGTYGHRVNLGPYLKGWSGDELIVDRKGGSGSPGTQIKVPEAVLTVSITVQPSALEALRSKPELVGRGFVQRFCYAWPRSLVGARTWDPDDDGAIPTATAWGDRIVDLGGQMSTWQMPAVVRLGPAARVRFFTWRQDLEATLGADGDDGMAEFVSKLTSSVVRTAALLHVAAGQPTSAEIAEDTLARAVDLGDYWLAHADAVWLQFGAAGSMADARVVLGWLRRTRLASFRRRDVYAANRRRFVDAEAAERAIVTLAEHGWVRPAGDTRRGSERSNPTWQTHPEAFR